MDGKSLILIRCFNTFRSPVFWSLENFLATVWDCWDFGAKDVPTQSPLTEHWLIPETHPSARAIIGDRKPQWWHLHVSSGCYVRNLTCIPHFNKTNNDDSVLCGLLERAKEVRNKVAKTGSLVLLFRYWFPSHINLPILPHNLKALRFQKSFVVCHFHPRLIARGKLYIQISPSWQKAVFQMTFVKFIIKVAHSTNQNSAAVLKPSQQFTTGAKRKNSCNVNLNAIGSSPDWCLWLLRTRLNTSVLYPIYRALKHRIVRD